MKIAVIGSGVSGLGAALALRDVADVALFERAARLGGHANTVEVAHTGARIAVDTGFIVFNARNYPNLCAMFAALGVATHGSDMSFGFSLDGGRMEYACDDIDKVFAQRLNALDPRYVWMFRDVLRFCRTAPRDLERNAAAALSLGEWLDRHRFSAWFRERFILPMGAAIWSTPAANITAFPAESFLRFFANHDLYTGLGEAMTWRTVTGGSREYVARIAAMLGARAHTRAGVASVRRGGGRVHLRFEDGSEAAFDHVILATHAPQARALLADRDPEETAVLAAFRTCANRAVLHRDAALMPKRRKVWSSWNLLAPGRDGAAQPVAVSYWMNRLQGLDPSRDLFVTLNPLTEPDPATVFATFDYAHPLYDAAAFAAQAAMDAIQGRGGVWYAGAWLGYGFHEDGLRAGLRVASALGGRPDWVRDTGAPLVADFAVAAQ